MLLRRGLVGMMATAILFGTVGALPSYASSEPKSYKNCKLLNKDYPHGVGRRNAKDKTASGKPVTNFKMSNTIYSYNDGKTPRHGREKDLDRDNDGIACEKR